MILKKFIFGALLIIPFSIAGLAQTGGKTKPTAIDAKQASTVKSSPAYAEILLRKTEREAELESLSANYTEEFPKVREIKYELVVLQNELDKMLATSAADAGKLTLALGKLIVRKAELATELWNLRRQYNDDHPEVKRVKRKIAVYEKAIRDILP